MELTCSLFHNQFWQVKWIFVWAENNLEFIGPEEGAIGFPGLSITIWNVLNLKMNLLNTSKETYQRFAFEYLDIGLRSCYICCSLTYSVNPTNFTNLQVGTLTCTLHISYMVSGGEWAPKQGITQLCQPLTFEILWRYTSCWKYSMAMLVYKRVPPSSRYLLHPSRNLTPRNLEMNPLKVWECFCWTECFELPLSCRWFFPQLVFIKVWGFQCLPVSQQNRTFLLGLHQVAPGFLILRRVLST